MVKDKEPKEKKLAPQKHRFIKLHVADHNSLVWRSGRLRCLDCGKSARRPAAMRFLNVPCRLGPTSGRYTEPFRSTTTASTFGKVHPIHS
eukprot:1607666-Pyramimonas_sp.AAC.1